MVDKAVALLDNLPVPKEPLARIKEEGLTFIRGPAIDAACDAAVGFARGAGNLLVQMVWILVFYFLLSAYSSSILQLLAELAPIIREHQNYIFREWTGTAGDKDLQLFSRIKAGNLFSARPRLWKILVVGKLSRGHKAILTHSA
jgi:hypothetical protein